MLRSSLSLALLTLPLVASPASAQGECSDLRLAPSPAIPGDSYGAHFDGKVLDLGDTRAVVGAPTDGAQLEQAGAVHVFEELAGGLWGPATPVRATVPAVRRCFGSSVSLDGDRLAVGAPGSFWPLEHVGRVHVFERSGGAWIEVAELTASDGVVGDRFGSALDLDGDTLVVGAPDQPGSSSKEGAVYVFERQGSSWVEVARLDAELPQSGDRLGLAVACEPGRIVAGCPGDRVGSPSGPIGRGAVYVYEGSGASWTRTARLLGVAPHTMMGTSVALSGDTLVGGADFAQSGGPYPGAAVVHEYVQGSWVQTAYLAPTAGNDQLGCAVALEGDALAVGARTALVYPAGSGQVRLYRRSGGTWVPAGLREGGDAASNYGNSLALHGGRLLIGDAGNSGESLTGSSHLVPFAGHWVTPFCLCTEAGCANTDPLAGCANVTGSGCRLTACGTTSLSRDDLVLIGTNTGPNAFGLVFMGRTQTPMTFFGNGRKCVEDPVSLLRFPVHFSGSEGVIREGPGMAALGTGTFPAFGQVMVGQTWNYQLWYRDPGACLTGSNVSNALAVTFTP